MSDLETSLKNLRTDYVDVLQLHNPRELPDPDDSSSSYAALLKAREEGMIRHIGITSHRLAVARRAVQSGLYETLQFPLSALSHAPELELIELCREQDVGVIAMKALCGGLLTDVDTAFAFLRRFDNVVPIWGCQAPSELEDFIRLEAAPPEYDESMVRKVEQEREQLGDSFCRGCGYCLPCPADIPIPMAARMSLLLRRAPAERFYSDEWREKMHRIEECEQCGQCHERCPYDLDPAAMMPQMLNDYEVMYDAHQSNG